MPESKEDVCQKVLVGHGMLEHGKDAQTPLAAISLGSDENLDGRPCAMRSWRAQI